MPYTRVFATSETRLLRSIGGSLERSDRPVRVTGGKTPGRDLLPNDLRLRTLFHWVFRFSEATRICGRRVWVRAIPCSTVAQQPHKIIQKRVALLGNESVSVVTVGTGPTQPGDPLCVSTSLAVTESP